MSTTKNELQTMALAYQQICAGEEPWIALGNFINDFFGYFVRRRQALIRDPIAVPESPTPEQLRWAAFCAASVEYLCQRYELRCPRWPSDAAYTLLEPWYTSPGLGKPETLARLRAETPEPFQRRNVYCGARVYSNKYPSSKEPGNLEELKARRRSRARSLAQQEVTV